MLASASNSVSNLGREALIKVCRSISECEAPAKGRLDRLIGGDLASSGASAAVLIAGEAGRVSRAGLSKLYVLCCIPVRKLF